VKVHKITHRAGMLYERGLSIEGVAEALEVNYRTARKAIHLSGCPLRDPSERLIGRTRPTRSHARTSIGWMASQPADPVVEGETWN